MEKSEIRETLFQIEHSRKKLLRPYFLEIGLTLGQGQPRILRNILKKGPMTQRELADICFLDVTTMSRTLDRLEEAGLLERHKNPDCRRSFLVALTEEGRKKAGQVMEGFAHLDETLVEGFSEEELETLLESLKRLQANLENSEEFRG